MIKAYKKFWLNFFNFKGRSTRSDYWYVVLINIVFLNLISLIIAKVPNLSLLDDIYLAVTLIPSTALVVRRYHDINKSGWNYLLIFVFIIGWIIVIINLCKPSVNKNNKYGEIL